MQKIIKEMIWYMDENPNKDGTYLYAQFSFGWSAVEYSNRWIYKKIWVEFK